MNRDMGYAENTLAYIASGVRHGAILFGEHRVNQYSFDAAEADGHVHAF